MYEQFFNFTGAPFSLLPDADFLFLSRRHSRAANLLEYGIFTQAGFMVITGDVGAGKTTIVRRYIKNAAHDVRLGVISNPTSASGRLLDWVCLAFDMDITPQQDEARLYHQFVDFLVKQYAVGQRCVLIIDEAQNLDIKKLEELRMLSNVNNEKDQLLQIVLVGQPELLENLKKPELRQFVQRVSVHCHLDALAPAETMAYIHHRLSVVGGAPYLFDERACATVHFFTGGVPRLINLLCDQALAYGFSEDQTHISSQVIAEVAQDRDASGLSPFIKWPSSIPFYETSPEIERLLRDMRRALEKEAEA